MFASGWALLWPASNFDQGAVTESSESRGHGIEDSEQLLAHSEAGSVARSQWLEDW
jgi:hypothetical protein